MRMSYEMSAKIESDRYFAHVNKGYIGIEEKGDPSKVKGWITAGERAKEQIFLIARARRIHRKLFGVNP